LMRCLSGARWGASKTALLTVYRALIRSLLDYGAEALDSASRGAVARFDEIQLVSLKLCCGAMRGTALQALQNECGEPPLALRRRRQQLRYCVKIQSMSDHPASGILMDHWTNHYGKKKDTIYTKVNAFLQNKCTIPTTKPDIDPPWSRDQVCVDIALARVLRKSDPEIECKALTLDMISRYADYLHVYTDGSKDEGGRVACSVCVPEREVNIKLRLSDNLSVYTAELAAIRKAVEISRDMCIAGESRNIAIFTDSLSSAQALDSVSAVNRPDIIQDIVDIIKHTTNQISIIWIPAHVGVKGNEKADQLAKQALHHPTVDISIPPEREDINHKIDEEILKEWQKIWSSSIVAKHYKIVQPNVSYKVKLTSPNRRKEVAITRLRLGVCKLNYYLFKQGNHASGLCSLCGVPETIQHFLIECRNSQVASKLQSICMKQNIQFNLNTVLNNKLCLDVMYDCLNKEI